MTDPDALDPADPRSERLPLASLLALALAGFITILTEALPAGLLPSMALSLDVSPTLAGQAITVYALGSMIAAIPLTLGTRRVRRRRLLLVAIFGFVVANGVTALSPAYAVTMAARLLAGMSAGLVWALLAGYAARLVPPASKGRAIAVAMVGTPLALSIGIPAGTFLGNLVGWRWCFGLIDAIALLLIGWVAARLPDFPGQSAGPMPGIGAVFMLPGVRSVLGVTAGFVLAHTILYTYIAPFLDRAGMAARTDLALLVFGLLSLAGIWIVGLLIDRHARTLTLASIALFAVAALALALGGRDPAIIYAAIVAWGLAFGGAATLFQTALSDAAGDQADLAQSLMVTVWNAAMAGGGLIGGIILSRSGVGGIAPAVLALLILSFLLCLRARRAGFPSDGVLPGQA